MQHPNSRFFVCVLTSAFQATSPETFKNYFRPNSFCLSVTRVYRSDGCIRRYVRTPFLQTVKLTQIEWHFEGKEIGINQDEMVIYESIHASLMSEPNHTEKSSFFARQHQKKFFLSDWFFCLLQVVAACRCFD